MEIQLKGLKEIINKLEPAKVREPIKKARAKGMVILQRELMTYPPKPPQSTYVRTMMLSGSWKWAARAEGARIWSDDLAAPYNLWVQKDPAWAPGRKSQAWMHQGRWRTEKMVWDSNKDRIFKIFVEEIMKVHK